MFWNTNVNYFFVIFDKFRDLNRCKCFEVDIGKPLKGPYTSLSKVRQYYGQLTVVSKYTYESHSSYDSSFED